MGRGSRSPSPGRRRDRRRRGRSRDRRRRSRTRSRSKERDQRDKDRSRSRSRDAGRSRSRDRRRRRTRTPPVKKVPQVERPKITEKELEGKSAEEVEMLRMMGFCTFDSTKGKQVNEKEPGAVHVILKRKYRQYMNRKGGFNRPLDFVA